MGPLGSGAQPSAPPHECMHYALAPTAPRCKASHVSGKQDVLQSDHSCLAAMLAVGGRQHSEQALELAESAR